MSKWERRGQTPWSEGQGTFTMYAFLGRRSVHHVVVSEGNPDVPSVYVMCSSGYYARLPMPDLETAKAWVEAVDMLEGKK